MSLSSNNDQIKFDSISVQFDYIYESSKMWKIFSFFIRFVCFVWLPLNLTVIIVKYWNFFCHFSLINDSIIIKLSSSNFLCVCVKVFFWRFLIDNFFFILENRKKLIPIIVVDYRMCFTIWISFRFFWIFFSTEKNAISRLSIHRNNLTGSYNLPRSYCIKWKHYLYFVSRHLLCFPIDFFHFILFSIEIQISGSGFLLPMVFFLDNFFLFFFTLIIGARFVRNSLRFVSLSWLLLLLIAVVVVVVTVAIISCCNHHKSRE